MAKKISIFVVQVIVMYITYVSVGWLYDAAFHQEYTLDSDWLFQGLLFAPTFVAYMHWRNNRKSH